MRAAGRGCPGVVVATKTGCDLYFLLMEQLFKAINDTRHAS